MKYLVVFLLNSHLFPIFGFFVFVAGIIILKKDRNKAVEWAKIEAKVTGHQESDISESDGDEYSTLYTYTLAGKEYSGVSSYASSKPAYKKGDMVTVFVDPYSPEKSELYDNRYIWMRAIPLILGIIFMIIGCIVSYYILTNKENH